MVTLSTIRPTSSMWSGLRASARGVNMCLPVHVRTSDPNDVGHWILAVCNFTSAAITIYDSLPSRHNECIAASLILVAQRLGPHIDGYNPADRWSVRDGICSVQVGTNDCSAFVACTLLSLIRAPLCLIKLRYGRVGYAGSQRSWSRSGICQWRASALTRDSLAAACLTGFDHVCTLLNDTNPCTLLVHLPRAFCLLRRRFSSSLMSTAWPTPLFARAHSLIASVHRGPPKCAFSQTL